MLQAAVQGGARLPFFCLLNNHLASLPTNLMNRADSQGHANLQEFRSFPLEHAFIWFRPTLTLVVRAMLLAERHAGHPNLQIRQWFQLAASLCQLNRLKDRDRRFGCHIRVRVVLKGTANSHSMDDSYFEHPALVDIVTCPCSIVFVLSSCNL